MGKEILEDKKRKRSSTAEEEMNGSLKEAKIKKRKAENGEPIPLEKSKKEKKEKKEGQEKKRKVEEAANGKMHEEISKKRKKEKAGQRFYTLSSPGATENKKLSEISELDSEIKKRLESKGISELFPIQHMTLDHILNGEDLVGRARTGTGKTFSFALPVIEKLMRSFKQSPPSGRGRAPKVLVVAPTRELAKQISGDFEFLAPRLKVTTIYGGTQYEPQERDLRDGIDIVVGTPGRLLDHLERKTLKFDALQFVILDEADEMLNFGFAPDIERILSTVPKEPKPQILLFSATLPAWVKQVAAAYLSASYIEVDLVGASKSKAADTIQHLAINCRKEQRPQTLADIVKVYGGEGRVIVFAQTKNEATELATSSAIRGVAEVIHGDIIQSQREITMESFRKGRTQVLVATDVASRGLDIPEVDLVVQCQPPKDSEAYIHRVGRTGRAGRQGTCITFFTKIQANDLKRLEKEVGIEFKRIGTPQAEDILRAAGKKSISVLDKVHPEMIEHFIGMASQLLEARGPSALAAALAELTGYTTPMKTRSLLSSEEGYTTVRVYSSRPIYTPKYVVSMISGWTTDVKEIRLLEDGAIFDVPTEPAKLMVAHTEEQLKMYPDRPPFQRYEIATSLPDLEIPEFKRRDGGEGGGRGGFGYGRDGGRSGGGFGGRSPGGRGGFGGRSPGGGRSGFGRDDGGFGARSPGARGGFGGRGRY